MQDGGGEETVPRCSHCPQKAQGQEKEGMTRVKCKRQTRQRQERWKGLLEAREGALLAVYTPQVQKKKGGGGRKWEQLLNGVQGLLLS